MIGCFQGSGDTLTVEVISAIADARQVRGRFLIRIDCVLFSDPLYYAVKFMQSTNPELEILNFPHQVPWSSALDDRKSVSASPAVYSITTHDPVPRLFCESRVLYIGKAKRLGGGKDRSRLYGYRYQPMNSRDGRIRAACERLAAQGHELTLRWIELEDVREAKALEARFLERIYDATMELPALNRSL